MGKRALIWTILSWVALTLFNYYYMPYFLLALEWLALSLILLIITFIQLGKLISERKKLSKLRIWKTITFATLFILTFYRNAANNVIEETDWHIFYSTRKEIVEKVKTNTLKPNVDYNNSSCELPFEFPVISNGGNDILISKENGYTTVTFWVFRNFFDSPSTALIYTDNPEEIYYYEKKIANKPEKNWKIQENWYRIYNR